MIVFIVKNGIIHDFRPLNIIIVFSMDLEYPNKVDRGDFFLWQSLRSTRHLVVDYLLGPPAMPPATASFERAFLP